MTLDLTPFSAYTIGFDRLFNELSSFRTISYPPYNIEKEDEGKYRLSMALAGFSEDDIEVSVKEDLLTIEGKKDKGSVDYLYKGIGERAFTQSFRLAEHIEVKEAKLENGVLNVYLKQDLPKEKQKRVIKIS